MLCLIIVPLFGLFDRRIGNLANPGSEFARSTGMRLLAGGMMYNGR